MTSLFTQTRKLLAATAAFAALAATPLAAATSGGAMSLIPKDAVTVGVVHLDDIRSSPLSAMLFEQTDKIGSNGEADRFMQDSGLQPTKDVDLVVVSTSPVTALGTEARVLVLTEGRFDVVRITTAITSRGAVKKTSPNGVYYTLPDKGADAKNGAVAFISNHLAAMGSEDAVVQALADNAHGGTTFTTASGLGREMKRLDAKATAWALVDVTRSSRLIGGAHVPSNAPQHQALSSALRTVSTVALWATDNGDSLKLGATGVSNDEETRQLLEDTIRGMISAWRLAASEKAPELVSVLRKFTVTNGSDNITISGTIPAETLKMLKAKAKHTISAEGSTSK
jgi:hypothetical protein